jgi:hypothetical protein
MPTENVYIRGKGSWIRTNQTNPWGKWVATIHPTPGEDLEKVRELSAAGVKNVIKKDDDGYFITYSRPSEKEDRMGRKYGLSPVQVVDNTGKPFSDLIGNGSDVTIKLEVYQHNTPGGGKAKAARLAAIRVDNLVPYIPDRDMMKDQKEPLKGMDEAKPNPAF